MAYPYTYGGYQPTPYYPGPVPDQLSQLRQQQMQNAMVPQNAPQQPDTGIIWVQGEAGAKAYLVAPGNTVQLWDSEDSVIYLKSADMSGMPSMRVLDYTERTIGQPTHQPEAKIDWDKVVTWDKLDDYITERLRKTAKTTKVKEDVENG